MIDVPYRVLAHDFDGWWLAGCCESAAHAAQVAQAMQATGCAWCITGAPVALWLEVIDA